jgi:uncharacterized membrane protein YgdD (TMEM256/DUF423 family)
MGATRLYAFLGAVNAFVAVAAGAFGAHALRERLDERMRDVFETGARYHLIHAVGLFGVAWLCSRAAPAAPIAGALMTAGIVLFSGSLYVLAVRLSQKRPCATCLQLQPQQWLQRAHRRRKSSLFHPRVLDSRPLASHREAP